MDDDLLLKDAEMAYDTLHAEFASDKWEKDHRGAVISVMNIDYMSEEDVEKAGARKMAYSFDVTAISAHDRGARDLFSFEAVRANCLRSRVFSCWCTGCVLSGCAGAEELAAAIRNCLPSLSTQQAREWAECEQHRLPFSSWDQQEMHEVRR
jgi:hypothetical protein